MSYLTKLDYSPLEIRLPAIRPQHPKFVLSRTLSSLGVKQVEEGLAAIFTSLSIAAFVLCAVSVSASDTTFQKRYRNNKECL